MGQPERDFGLVSSQYGPGVMGCWILCIASVFVSWTLHKDYRNSDSIDGDLFAMLWFPFIAACDVIAQVVKRPRGFQSENDLKPSDMQHLAALQAPLSVVYLFCSVARLLLFVAQQRANKQMDSPRLLQINSIPKEVPLKRSLAISVTWLVCSIACVIRNIWGITRAALYAESIASMLQQLGFQLIRDWEQFSSLESILMVCSISILSVATWGLLIADLIAQAYMTLIISYPVWCRCRGRPQEEPVIFISFYQVIARQSERTARILSPFFFTEIVTWGVGVLVGMKVYNPFQVSGNSIKELDQAFALSCGIAAFAFWLRDTLQSRTAKHSRTTAQSAANEPSTTGVQWPRRPTIPRRRTQGR